MASLATIFSLLLQISTAIRAVNRSKVVAPVAALRIRRFAILSFTRPQGTLQTLAKSCRRLSRLGLVSQPAWI
jgi:hypothetical protein